MHDFEYEFTDFGVIGFMPSGEEREFATEDEYEDAYTDEVNEIVDEMARLHSHDEPVDYPDHHWLEYA